MTIDRTKFNFLLSVAMHREKEELVDGPYRRDFLTYDNHILDGEIFLQVSFFEIIKHNYLTNFGKDRSSQLRFLRGEVVSS